MSREIRLTVAALLAAGGLSLTVTGCKPKTAQTEAFFQTQFQTESQFIVEAIAADLAEQVTFAASRQLPEPAHFFVTATEKPESPVDAPAYALNIRLAKKKSGLKLDLKVDEAIWSPAVYETLTRELARTVGLRPVVAPATSENTGLLARLTNISAEDIEREDQVISAALQKNFCDSALHERAALLLGAFLLRDHGGRFYDIRLPLSRLTAHLAIAHFLRGTQAPGLNDQMAEALLFTLIGNETAALERLQAIKDPLLQPLVRALRARNTGDYRPLDKLKDRSPLENLEWYCTKANLAGPEGPWEQLAPQDKRNIDFIRVANFSPGTVEIGHELLRAALPLEMREITSIYELTHSRKLSASALVNALNELPERCFTRAPGGVVQVHVIGWGQWAFFLQRHLCNAVQANFRFMYRSWGVPDEAKEFAAACDKQFAGLRLYPFVRRYNCTEPQGYRAAVDDGFKVVRATPHLVPAHCWDYLCAPVRAVPVYRPYPNPHIGDWLRHDPPPGTGYELGVRLSHGNLTGRPDFVERLEALHALAPSNFRVTAAIMKQKYKDRPTYAQAMELYGPLMPYSVEAVRWVASTLLDKPAEYEKLILQGAVLDSGCYYDLGNYYADRAQDDKAAQFLDKACDADLDAVRVSNYSLWRVRYYLHKGDTEKARRIADFAAEVYSGTGLEAKAVFLEHLKRYDEAFQWFAKIEERYKNTEPLVDFCLRHAELTGSKRFEPELNKRLPKLFPNGLEKVTLNDFQAPPVDGVVLQDENQVLRSAGLKKGDIIVAVYGTRVHNTRQYTYGRQMKTVPQLDLIVWQGNRYRELKPSPPGHLFGVPIRDYQPTLASAQ